MRQRNDWLNAVFQAFVEQIIIKLQASLVGLQLIALRENTRPAIEVRKHLKPISANSAGLVDNDDKIDRLMVRVVFPGHHAVGNFPRHAVAPAVITSATLIPCRPPASRPLTDALRPRRPTENLL